MKDINYSDISAVYSGVYTQPHSPQMVDDDEFDEPDDEFDEPDDEFDEFDGERAIRSSELQQSLPTESCHMRTIEDDPMRDLLTTVAGFWIGDKIVDSLVKPYRWFPSGNDDWSRGERARTVREMRERGEIP